MKARSWRSFVLSVLIALAAHSARSARADAVSVTVLGVRSLDGEDQLERRISQALPQDRCVLGAPKLDTELPPVDQAQYLPWHRLSHQGIGRPQP